IAWRAFLTKGGTLVRLDQALQHLSAATHRGLLGVDIGDLETVLGVELAILVRQPPTAVGYHSDTAPAPIGDLEYVLQQGTCSCISLRQYDSPVRVLYGVFT